MAYNPNIPLANEKLSQSQPNILNNFIAIGNVLNPDNGTIKLPVQIAAQATAAGQISLYSKIGTGTPAVQSLFWRQESNGTEHDMTSRNAAVNGWTMLPSGIMLQWGTGITGGVITFPKAFTTACFSITATQANVGGTNRDFIFTDPAGTISFSPISKGATGTLTSVNIHWMAIGY